MAPNVEGRLSWRNCAALALMLLPGFGRAKAFAAAKGAKVAI